MDQRNELLTRHGDAIQDEAVQVILVDGVCSLDDDYVDRARETGILHEGDAELGVVFAAVGLAQADHVCMLPRAEDVFDDARVAPLCRHSVGHMAGRASRTRSASHSIDRFVVMLPPVGKDLFQRSSSSSRHTYRHDKYRVDKAGVTVFSPELKRGSAEFLVLSLLDAEARHGYELGKLIESRSAGRLTFQISSLYPVLYRMEGKGWIKGRWVEKEGQRSRKYYRITPDGERALAAKREVWLAFTESVNQVVGMAGA